MKINDILKFCIKSNRKYYKQFCLFIVLLSILVFGMYTFKDSLISYLYNGIMKQYNYNYVYSNPYNLDREEVKKNLKEINHVKEVFEPYQDVFYINLEKIDNDKHYGSFILAGKSDYEMKELSKNKYINESDVICPKNFYYSDDISSKRFVNRNEIIKLSNNSLKTYYYKRAIDDTIIKRVDVDLNVVNTYKNNKYIIDENICYASRDLLTKLFNDSYPKNYFGDQIDSIVFSIDSNDNHQYVKEEVEKLGYEFSDVYYVDYSFLNFIKKMSNIILISSVFFVILLIININKKRFYDKINEFNVLASIGYSNKEVKKILRYDSILSVGSSVLISFLIICLITILLKIIIYFYPFIFEKLFLKFNYKFLVIFYSFIIIIFIISFEIYYSRLVKVKEKSQ